MIKELVRELAEENDVVLYVFRSISVPRSSLKGIAEVIFKSIGLIFLLPATLIIKFARRQINHRSHTRAITPKLGELLVCLFAPSDRHKDRLGDFEELYTTLWLPRFGPRLAKTVYIAQALRSAAAAVRIGAMVAVADRVLRVFGRG